MTIHVFSILILVCLRGWIVENIYEHYIENVRGKQKERKRITKSAFVKEYFTLFFYIPVYFIAAYSVDLPTELLWYS